MFPKTLLNLLGEDGRHDGGGQQAGDGSEGPEGRTERRQSHPRVHRFRHHHRHDLRGRRVKAIL